MKNLVIEFLSDTRLRLTKSTLTAALLPALALLVSAPPSQAGSATWNLTPVTGDWNTAANWTPATVPHGPGDTATFASSDQTSLTVSNFTEVNGITFNLGATAFSVTINPAITLTFSGVGLINSSGNTQNFVANVADAGGRGIVNFTNNANAGTSTTFTNDGAMVSDVNGGLTQFFASSSAGNATFVNKSGSITGSLGGLTEFYDSSTAAGSTLVNSGSAGPGSGTTLFFDTSTAGGANIANHGAAASGGRNAATIFLNESTAGNAAVDNQGGEFSGAFGGRSDFQNISTAGDGNFINSPGSVSGAYGGYTSFSGSSKAGNATFINEGGAVSGALGGDTSFLGTSNAGNATLVAEGGLNGGQGGTISFFDGSVGGNAEVRVFGNGMLSLVDHNLPGVTIGSIAGSGCVSLGVNLNLTAGSNNLSTTFSGVIFDNSGSGSLTKIGTGTLILSAVNAYGGGTSIVDGTLVAANDGALGTGDVSLPVSSATLTLQNGTTNNYIADTASVTIVSNSTLNLDFTGSPDRAASLVVDGVEQMPGLYGSAESGATNQLPEFFGPGEILIVGPGPAPSPSPSASPSPTVLGNISTRLRVGTDDNVLIAGFIITGLQPKKVLLRGIGPSLPLAGQLADPILELVGPNGLIMSNDNWRDSPDKQEIIDRGFALGNDLESAIVATLAGNGLYTVILRGASNGAGIGLVEAYDLDLTVDSELANISTRGFVQTLNDVMIGGFNVLGGDSQEVLIRAIGPSLPVAGKLANPTLELYDKEGALITSSDDWKETQQSQIEATGLAPRDDRESAILLALAPDSYTAIVRGKDGSTGVALVEVYNVIP